MTGYYVCSDTIAPGIALQYCSAGGDPGMSFREALEYLTTRPKFQIIDNKGKIILHYDQIIKHNTKQ